MSPPVLLLGNALLLGATLALIVVRVVRYLRGVRDADTPTYPEPGLRVDAEPKAAHDVFGELASTLSVERAGAERQVSELRVKSDRLSAALPVSRRLLVAAAGAWLLVLLPYSHPSFGRLRVLSSAASEAQVEGGVVEEPPVAAAPLPPSAIGEAKLPGATYDQQARARELDAPLDDASRGPIAREKQQKPPPIANTREIEDASGKALARFFNKLGAVAAARASGTGGGAEEASAAAKAGAEAPVLRVLYFGDSIIASDFVTGKLRRLYQTRFGDAGHGYALLANAWPGYFHIDVARAASGEWRTSTCVGPYAADALYGLGCASFVAKNKGIWATFGTAGQAEWGRSVSRFELEYLRAPGGGAVELVLDEGKDGGVRQVLETEAASELSWHTVRTTDGPHALTIRTLDARPVRLFGVRMERDVAGVTVSALGITGARARFLDQSDDAHFAAVLRAARPDLVVLSFGSNEITDGNMVPMEEYRASLALVMAQLEKAVPDASRMMVGPPDMASNKPSQGYSRPMVHVIVENQRRLASERGWAFWDQYRAMGGGGSMHAWVKAGLGSSDLFHPTGRGGSMLADWQFQAMMRAFDAHAAAALPR
ncbi:MAG: hypothetical protein EXR75_08455 [Myxococcales bacterium]|nr:hypothetical protein [Myxococcales bacterium]